MADNHFKIHKGVTLAPQSSMPSNPVDGDIYYDSTLNSFRKYENGAWSNFGSGNGSGGINYITNPDFETDLSDWNVYDDGTAIPTTGIGGTPTELVLNLNTARALRGKQSLGISATISGSGLGEGVSTNFTVDGASSDKSTNLYVSFDYRVPYTFVQGDYVVYIYDVTNSTLLGTVQNDDNGVLLHTGSTSTNDFVPGRFVGKFQTVAGSTDYRLLIHSTTANPKSIIIDNIKVGPDTLVPGAIITEWQQYTPTVNNLGSGTLTSADGWYRRIGDTIELKASIQIGTAGTGSSVVHISRPSGIVFDTSKMPPGNNGGVDVISFDIYSAGAFATSTGFPADIGFGFFNPGSGSLTGSSFRANSTMSIHTILPVAGWSAGALLSTTEANKQVISATYQLDSSTKNTSFASGVFERLDANFKIRDTHNAVSIDTGISPNSPNNDWVFTAPRKGFYEIECTIGWANTGNLTQSIIKAVKSGSASESYIILNTTDVVSNPGSASKKIWLEKDDVMYIELRQNDSGGAARNIAFGNNVRIDIVSYPDFSTFSVFGETELIESKSSGAIAYSITANQWGDLTSISLNPGEYDITLQAIFSANTSATTPNIGLSTNPGNDSTGLMYDDTATRGSNTINGILSINLTVNGVNVNSSITYYLKAYQATITGSPAIAYKISARRIK